LIRINLFNTKIYYPVCFILSPELQDKSQVARISLCDAIHFKPVNSESILLALRHSLASY